MWGELWKLDVVRNHPEIHRKNWANKSLGWCIKTPWIVRPTGMHTWVTAEDLRVEKASRTSRRCAPCLSTAFPRVNYIGIHLMCYGSSSNHVECAWMYPKQGVYQVVDNVSMRVIMIIDEKRIHPTLVVYGNTLPKFTLFLASCFHTLSGLYLAWLQLVTTYLKLSACRAVTWLCVTYDDSLCSIAGPTER